MKKLLSIFAAVGLTATTSATVVACGDKGDKAKFSFEGSGEVTTTVGLIDWNDLLEKGLKNYKEYIKFNEEGEEWFKGNVNDEDLEEFVTEGGEITVVNGDKDSVKIDNWDINFTKAGEFELNTNLKMTFKKELIGKSNITLKVTVKDKPSFSFNF